jgi:hypothetical protein
MMRRLAVIGFGATCLLLGADEARQKAQVSNTERIDFPPGGTLRLTNSIGMLTVEAWDRPDVEITTIKSTKDENDRREKAALDKVHVGAARRGDQLVITTDFPRHRFRHPLAGEGTFDLEYRIKAPANARVIANHHVGEVNIVGLVGDIDVTLFQGQVNLSLPQEGRYDIHAKSASGNVYSDFSGQEKRRWWLVGHRIVTEDSPGLHQLNLKVGFGDIVILKTPVPKTPASQIPASKAN